MFGADGGGAAAVVAVDAVGFGFVVVDFFVVGGLLLIVLVVAVVAVVVIACDACNAMHVLHVMHVVRIRMRVSMYGCMCGHVTRCDLAWRGVM